jgi:hypothetical protein
MKKALIVALVCINILLVAVLVNFNATKAQAQTERGANNFIMVTGRVESGFDAVWVLDLKSRRLGAWRFDRTKRILVPYVGRILTTDFGSR